MKFIYFVTLVFTLVFYLSSVAHAKFLVNEYCEYTVEEEDKLDFIIKNFLKDLGVEGKNSNAQIYSPTGWLAQIQWRNSLYNVNTLKVGQVIFVPCILLGQVGAGAGSASGGDSAHESKRKFKYGLEAMVGSKFINSKDKTNSSRGEVFVFPLLGIALGGQYELIPDHWLGLKGGLKYGGMDNANVGNRRLTRQSVYLYDLMAYYTYEWRDFSFTPFLQFQNNLFFRGSGNDKVLIIRKSYLSLGAEVQKKLWQHFKGGLGLSSSFQALNTYSGFKNGREFYLLGAYDFNETWVAGTRVTYEKLKMSSETQENYLLQFKVGMNF